MSPSPTADNFLVTQSPGVGASGIADQYADGKAAKVDTLLHAFLLVIFGYRLMSLYVFMRKCIFLVYLFNCPDCCQIYSD